MICNKKTQRMQIFVHHEGNVQYWHDLAHDPSKTFYILPFARSLRRLTQCQQAGWFHCYAVRKQAGQLFPEPVRKDNLTHQTHR